MTALDLDEEGVTQAGMQLMTNGVQGVTQSIGALAPALTPAPAGMDEVSAAASAGHGAFTVSWQAINAFMNQEIVRLGGAFMESVAEYKLKDVSSAATI
ncbi:PE-like protein [Mycobacteroides abscessus subsp. massiliense]|uniref:PE-like protein n=1 Tax=Mycobacteroides abscessus subsp. massiliense TaxID=1962118 RepID=A0A1T8VAC0_9MYCO|nr:PE domain-containing protein [Mycobacteroides abscessus]SKN01993.1 PE-like protein [Mycobacteroides abscessus subsp. massiliense]